MRSRACYRKRRPFFFSRPTFNHCLNQQSCLPMPRHRFYARTPIRACEAQHLELGLSEKTTSHKATLGPALQRANPKIAATFLHFSEPLPPFLLVSCALATLYQPHYYIKRRREELIELSNLYRLFNTFYANPRDTTFIHTKKRAQK